jgi:hypothetical protein
MSDLFCLTKTQIVKVYGSVKVTIQWVTFKKKYSFLPPIDFLFCLEPNTFSKEIAKCVKDYMPDKHITPAVFRRVVPTIVFDKQLHFDGQSAVDFIVQFAKLNNTSEAVNPFNFTFFEQLNCR